MVVVELIAQGMTPLAISGLPGMPGAYDIKLWENCYPEFRDAMKVARQAWAEVLADRALKIAHESEFGTSRSDKIKVETALKLAACWDPERYGNKTKITGDPNAPLTFLISTGITRSTDNGKPLQVELDYTDPAKKHEKVLQETGPKDSAGEVVKEGGGN